jgi:peptidyl-dipeptidase Dcp
VKYKILIPVLGLSAVLSACSQESPSPAGTIDDAGQAATAALQDTLSAEHNAPSAEPDTMSNPLFAQSTLPFGLPAFDLIRDEHFAPALQRGMELEMAEVNAIISTAETANFENTIIALERTGADLQRVQRVFSNITGTHTNPTLQAVQREFSPLLAAHGDAISLNADLFERINHVYQQRSELGLDPESLRLLERYHTNFVRAGALLTAPEKDRLREINGELARMGTLFNQHVLAEVNDSAVLVDTAEELAGLTDAQIQAAANSASANGQEGKYLLALLNTSGQPILSSLENRALRERIHNISLARGTRSNDYDTRALVADTARLRAERAQLLGYDTHADFSLELTTAGSKEAVNTMLADIAPVAVANAQREAADIQQLINNTEAEPFEMAAWDWSFYAEKVRRERYAFDDAEVRPYFELNNVLTKGVFYAANQIFGISFTARPDLPLYHPDVQIWEATDADGTALGLVITDFYARPSKRGGAWASNYALPSGLLGGAPLIAMHQNVSKPADGEPTLISFTEATTMFHEFGHVLHGLLTDVRYPLFAGTAVSRDFVEFPSQVYEMWTSWPEVLENYATHYETGDRIPQQLLDKVLAAGQFNQGFGTTEYIASSIVDQALHQLPPEQVPSAEALTDFEQQVLTDAGLNYGPVPPRYRLPYFSHIMGGYSAGYYSYIWSEVLDADGVEWFKENGGMSREAGQHFRDTVLSRGGSVDAMQIYQEFAGRSPDMIHMLRRRGLAE